MVFTKFSHFCISRKYFRIFAKFSYFACSPHIYFREKNGKFREMRPKFCCIFFAKRFVRCKPLAACPWHKKSFSIILKKFVGGDKVFFQLNTNLLWSRWYFYVIVRVILLYGKIVLDYLLIRMLRDIECWDFNDTLNN